MAKMLKLVSIAGCGGEVFLKSMVRFYLTSGFET